MKSRAMRAYAVGVGTTGAAETAAVAGVAGVIVAGVVVAGAVVAGETVGSDWAYVAVDGSVAASTSTRAPVAAARGRRSTTQG